jgi:hypothetical protein
MIDTQGVWIVGKDVHPCRLWWLAFILSPSRGSVGILNRVRDYGYGCLSLEDVLCGVLVPEYMGMPQWRWGYSRTSASW